MKTFLPIVLKLNYSSHPTRRVTGEKGTAVKEDTGRLFVETESQIVCIIAKVQTLKLVSGRTETQSQSPYSFLETSL